ncbi:hypothetical protein BDP27DRAFT_895962 [Rhodocollybia butyracea]|uniref:Uncharacterized protein n=1 Tax=Rhodocollybia butyracea TaxID=206335 RepID=A0A9P5UEI9_9AGAR|nr:hypothetical protein BDP27DRAFT_895962 [Rhodocollybia butyracea]
MSTMSAVAKGKQPAVSLGPIRTSREHGHGHHIHTNGANVSPRFGHPPAVGSSMHHDMMDWRDGERSSKLRRMDFDDDSSAISSSDVHSTGRSMSRMSQMSTVSQLSQMSFATVASVDTVGSDPGPSRSMIRNRPSLLGLNRMTSTASSLRTSFDFASSSNLSVPSPIPPVPPLPQMRLLTPSQSYPRSTRTPHTPHTPHTARSSNSFSLDGQLAHDFRTQASMETDSPHMNGMNGSVSPPPINLNILSLSASPSLSPRPSLDSLSISSPSPSQSQWTLHPHQRAETLSSRRGQASPGQIHVMAQRRSMSHSPSPYESRELREYDYRERERSQEPGERGRGSMYPAQHGCDAQGVGGYYHANNHPPQGVVVGTNPGLKHSRSESDDINPIFKVVSFSYGSDSRGLDLALADKAKDKYTSVFNANLNPSSPSTSSYASSSYASSISYSHSHSLSLSSYSQPPLPTPSTSSESEEYYHDNDSESDAMDTYQGDYTYSAMDDRMESPDPQDYSSDDYHSSGVMYGDQHQYHRNPNPAAYPHPHPSPDPNATHLNGLPNGLHRHHQRHPPSLPPFAALDAVAGGGYDYSSLSPMSFTTPLESDSSSS